MLIKGCGQIFRMHNCPRLNFSRVGNYGKGKQARAQAGVHHGHHSANCTAIIQQACKSAGCLILIAVQVHPMCVQSASSPIQQRSVVIST